MTCLGVEWEIRHVNRTRTLQLLVRYPEDRTIVKYRDERIPDQNLSFRPEIYRLKCQREFDVKYSVNEIYIEREREG